MDAIPADRSAPALSLPVDCEAAIPLGLADWLSDAAAIAVFVARDDAALQSLVRIMPIFAPDRHILALPGWDNLPYDRARPSRRVTGQRVATLAWVARQQNERALVVTTPEALLQRVPPRGRMREREVPLVVGQALDPEWLRDTLLGFGYGFNERVEEPGEAALHGATMDLHLAGAAAPLRLELSEGRIASMRWFDPVTQRSTEEVETALLLPTTEAFSVPGEALPDASTRLREPLLPDGPLETLFDYLSGASWAVTESTEARCRSWLELVQDSYEVARIAVRAGEPPPALPDRLYLAKGEFAVLGNRGPAICPEPETQGEPPVPLNALARHILAAQNSGDAIILAGRQPVSALRPVLARRLRLAPEQIAPLVTWEEALDLAPRAIGLLHAPFEYGVRLPGRVLLAIQGTQAAAHDDDLLARLAGALRIGDLVVEPTRGLARLTGLAMEEQAGAPAECLRLAFLGGEALLLPGTEADRIWRYGAASSVKPDRLSGTAWQARCAEVERDIDATAAALVQRMHARSRIAAPEIEPNQTYHRFVRRRPYPLTRDQVRAVRAVQQDLASGRPMLRLICGDVGYGKTEIALHAACLVAAAGRQVAVIAPTTLLAQQHLEVFRRQLAGSGIRIGSLIRSSRSAAAQRVLRDLRAGALDIVVGTQAAAAARFRSLGLIVIDEEQRFGEVQKRRLHALQDTAHALIMTGTPLPRSLQSALAGLLDVSLLATPPAARQGGRTLVVPLDPVVVRAALLREARRNGQSFVVCPRIEDIAPMQERLRELVPELTLAVAHGRLRGEALDQVMMDFAGGAADVLLSTSIIEAGLDLPNANTMLIWRPERFGLSQLHQLRGRVGRGRERASTYLLTDPATTLSRGAHKRLETLATLDTLGAGFSISLADLDQRGAGDLLGERQSGHVRLFGTELYRAILERALLRARGSAVPDPWRPQLVLDAGAFMPAACVPEPEERLAIYRQVAACASQEAIDAAEADLADRFGELPEPAVLLLDVARLRLACRTLGIARVQAGPSAIGLTPHADDGQVLEHLPDARWHKGRLLLPIAEASPPARLRRLLTYLAPLQREAPSADPTPA
jgi:transcription-repair coupling factor (superfamily II helicase)